MLNIISAVLAAFLILTVISVIRLINLTEEDYKSGTHMYWISIMWASVAEISLSNAAQYYVRELPVYACIWLLVGIGQSIMAIIDWRSYRSYKKGS
jgi:uncharacterized membrane protein